MNEIKVKSIDKNEEKICLKYIGLACIDGTCPKANISEYIEMGMDAIRSCTECTYYRRCEDCITPEIYVCGKHKT